MISEFEDEWMGAASLWMVSTMTGELAATAARAKLMTDLMLKASVVYQIPKMYRR